MELSNKEVQQITDATKAVINFRKQYPSVTSSDIQSFVKGWNAAINHNQEHKEANELLIQVNTTLFVHGRIDAGTELNQRIQYYFDKQSI